MDHNRINISDDHFGNYEIIKKLGKGVYSDVFLATSEIDKQDKVLKIYKKPIEYVKCAEREIEFLKKLKDSKYIINILDNFIIDNYHTIVLDRYDCDLYQVIKNYEYYNEIEYIIYSMLKGLKHLERLDIIHADLKPENILVSIKKDKVDKVVISDLGSSDFIKNYQKDSENIVTLYYRAPEIYLGDKLSCSVDIWSLGCIIFELIYKSPLFKINQTKNYKMDNNKLFINHCRALGEPHSYLKLTSRFIKLVNLNKYNFKTEYYYNNSKELKDYLSYFIDWDYKKRKTAKEILKIKFPKNI